MVNNLVRVKVSQNQAALRGITKGGEEVDKREILFRVQVWGPLFQEILYENAVPDTNELVS